MARYKKIDVRIWNDAKFNALSSDAQLIFLYLLTSPQTTMLGAVPVDKHTVSRILKFDDIRYDIGYKQLSEYGMLEYDEAGIFWIKNFLKYNPPENPKVVISYASLLDLFPECPLLIKISKSVLRACETRGEAYVNALHPEFTKLAKYDISNGIAYGIAYGMPYQEQEQEQEQEIYTHTEKNEKQLEVAKSFAGRVTNSSFSDSESLKNSEPVDDELPLVEVSEVVETAPVSSKPKTEKKSRSTGKATKAIDDVIKPDDVNEPLWSDFSKLLNARGKPITYSFIGLLRKQAKNAGWTLEEIIEEIVLRGSTYVKAEWLTPKDRSAVWVKAEEYQPELPPVEYAPSAQKKFDSIMAHSTYAYDIKDLSQLERVVKKEAK